MLHSTEVVYKIGNVSFPWVQSKQNMIKDVFSPLFKKDKNYKKLSLQTMSGDLYYIRNETIISTKINCTFSILLRETSKRG